MRDSNSHEPLAERANEKGATEDRAGAPSKCRRLRGDLGIGDDYVDGSRNDRSQSHEENVHRPGDVPAPWVGAVSCQPLS